MKFEVFSLSLTKQEITLHFLKRKNLSHSPALYILQYKKSIFFTNAQKPQRRWVSLGFLFGVLSLVWVESCVTFQRFGNIRSTYGKSAETPKQYAEIPQQKHPKQKHLRDY